jgi:predicted CoA-binding protein
VSFQNPEEHVIFDYLRNAKTVAIVGMSDNTGKSSYMIAEQMQMAGYTIIPVNPMHAGKVILGETVYATLADVPVHIDIVDIFRRAEFLPQVAREFIETDADVYWAQLGLESDEAEAILRNAGRDKIVMDRCTKIELMRMNWEN